MRNGARGGGRGHGRGFASCCTQDTLTDELATLRTLDRTQLSQRWQELYGRAPPSNAAHPLLVMAVAYKIQEAALGGLRPAYRRRLQQSVDTKKSSSITALLPGTILLREWHGTTYSVTILDKGVQLQGRVYRSLTEVARFITGNHQSGHVFFGLKSKAIRAQKCADDKARA